MKDKKRLVFVAVAFILIAGSIFLFLQKNAPEKTFEKYDPNAPWAHFDSAADVGLTVNFAFDHPENWMHTGSRDGGAGSIVNFYLKNNLGQKDCNEGVIYNEVFLCQDYKIANFSVHNLFGIISFEPAKYDSELSEDIIIDGHKATKISGYVKEDRPFSTKYAYAGEPGQKEMKVVIQSVDNWSYEFSMVITNPEDAIIFNKIVNSIKIKSKSELQQKIVKKGVEGNGRFVEDYGEFEIISDSSTSDTPTVYHNKKYGFSITAPCYYDCLGVTESGWSNGDMITLSLNIAGKGFIGSVVIDLSEIGHPRKYNTILNEKFFEHIESSPIITVAGKNMHVIDDQNLLNSATFDFPYKSYIYRIDDNYLIFTMSIIGPGAQPGSDEEKRRMTDVENIFGTLKFD